MKGTKMEYETPQYRVELESCRRELLGARESRSELVLHEYDLRKLASFLRKRLNVIRAAENVAGAKIVNAAFFASEERYRKTITDIFEAQENLRDANANIRNLKARITMLELLVERAVRNA